MVVIRSGDRYRNMAGHWLTIRYVDEDKVIFQYESERMSTLPRSTVEHAIRSARWTLEPVALNGRRSV